MYTPSTRERVEVTGQPGIFLVIAVDFARRSADLIPLAGASFGLEGVSFAALRPSERETPPLTAANP